MGRLFPLVRYLKHDERESLILVLVAGKYVASMLRRLFSRVGIEMLAESTIMPEHNLSFVVIATDIVLGDEATTWPLNLEPQVLASYCQTGRYTYDSIVGGNTSLYSLIRTGHNFRDRYIFGERGVDGRADIDGAFASTIAGQGTIADDGAAHDGQPASGWPNHDFTTDQIVLGDVAAAVRPLTSTDVDYHLKGTERRICGDGRPTLELSDTIFDTVATIRDASGESVDVALVAEPQVCADDILGQVVGLVRFATGRVDHSFPYSGYVNSVHLCW